MAYYKKNLFEIPDFTEKKTGYSIREIKVGVIDEDAENDKIYNEDKKALHDLINDIDSVGLITPLTVRRNKVLSDRYTLIAGHRRLKAVKSLGHKTVPCLVVSTESEEECMKADVMHLTSNIMTRERTILERAKETKLLKERILALKKIDPDAYKGKTDEIVAKMMKVSSSYVRQLVRVENADDEIKDLLEDEVIGIAEALKLQRMDAIQRKEVAKRIMNTSDDGEVKNKHSSDIKRENAMEEIIVKDFVKLNKIIDRISSNLNECDNIFSNSIEEIIFKLNKII